MNILAKYLLYYEYLYYWPLNFFSCYMRKKNLGICILLFQYSKIYDGRWYFAHIISRDIFVRIVGTH